MTGPLQCGDNGGKCLNTRSNPNLRNVTRAVARRPCGVAPVAVAHILHVLNDIIQVYMNDGQLLCKIEVSIMRDRDRDHSDV
jgi:hypothetical protein